MLEKIYIYNISYDYLHTSFDQKTLIDCLHQVGEYEAYKRREKKKGGLYPLNEEGEYGPPPSALPPPLPGYKKRERKPKVYASYAVSR